MKPLIENVEKKLSEARFFLEKMIDQERMASRDIDFYLSAFLSAGRTVDYRLRHEQETIYPTWRTGWDAALSQAQQDLIKFMVEDRNVEVHRGGSTRVVKTEDREVGPGTHSLATGTHEVSAPPDVFPAAIIRTHAYYFTIDGIERKATEACAEYLRLLEQMVAKFKADKPTEIESEIDAIVEVVAPVLKGEGMWRFLFGTMSLTAKLLDDEFRQRIESGKESFCNGDLLKVRLKTIQGKHFIVKVIDRKPRSLRPIP